MRFLVAYLATLTAFVAIDLVWLGVVAKSLYRREMGDLLANPMNWKAGGLFYLLYPLGVVFFATMPALAAGSWSQALVLGALLGLFGYGTYDLTNLAVIRNWSTQLAIVDWVWGAALTGMAATVGYFVARSW